MAALYEKKDDEFVYYGESTLVCPYLPGYYLVRVRPYSQSIYYGVEPDYMAVEAAIQEVAGDMMSYLLEGMRPSVSRETTELEKRAYAAYMAVLDEDPNSGKMISFEGISANDLVERALVAVRERLQMEGRLPPK